MSGITPSIMAHGNTSTTESASLVELLNTNSDTLGTRSPSSTPATAVQTRQTFQKLCGTFGHSRLGEKLRLYGNAPGVSVKQKQAPTYSSRNSNCPNSSPSGYAHPSKRIRSDKIKPFTIDEESSEDFFENSATDQKDSGVDPGEEHVIVPIPLKNLRHCKSGSNSGKSYSNTRYVIEVDDDLISAGFPSDLPSGLIDIEGNFIGEFDFQFGLEDDDFDSLDCDDNFLSGESESINKGRTFKKKETVGLLAKKKKSSSLSTRETKDTAQQIIYHSPSTLLNMAEEGSYHLGNNYCNSNSQTSNTGQEDNENSNSPENKVLASPQRTFVHRIGSRSPHAPLDRHHSSGATSNTSTITVHYYPVKRSYLKRVTKYLGLPVIKLLSDFEICRKGAGVLSSCWRPPLVTVCLMGCNFPLEF